MMFSTPYFPPLFLNTSYTKIKATRKANNA